MCIRKADNLFNVRSSQDLLQSAFLKAKEIIIADGEDAHLDQETRRLFEIESDVEFGTSMLDVQQDLLRAAQDNYQGSSAQQCKARKWLVALSERVTYYGQIFDVLVQHHPEYVSLAWGTFKFVFTVSFRHGNGTGSTL